MTRSEFEGGIPRRKIEKADCLVLLQTRYGEFATSVLQEVKKLYPTAPDDILTVGDNWYQLVKTGNYSNGDGRWPIEGRNRANIFDLMQDIKEGVKTGSLDNRILESLAVLDITKYIPPLSQKDLYRTIKTPWGKIGVLKGTTTLIYYITRGYAQQIKRLTV